MQEKNPRKYAVYRFCKAGRGGPNEGRGRPTGNGDAKRSISQESIDKVP
jgi:hypothetical protein